MKKSKKRSIRKIKNSKKIHKTKKKSKSLRKVRKNVKRTKKVTRKKRKTKKTKSKKVTKKKTKRRRKQKGGGVFGKRINNVKTEGIHEKITIQKDDEEIIYTVPKTIYIDGEEFTLPKKINKGAYGTVYKYSKPKNIVVKIGEVDADIKVGKALSNTNCHSGIIDFQEHEGDDKNMIFIMEELEGDLSDLIRKQNLTYKTIHRFIFNIAKILECLMENDIYYTDLKSKNVLYKIKNGFPMIYLGDLGGGMPTDEYYSATYPSFDRRYKEGLFKEPRESDLSWSVGVLLIEMLKENSRKFYFDDIQYLSKSDLSKITNEMVNKYNKKGEPQIAKILEGTLKAEPNERLTLKEIQNIIKPNSKLYQSKTYHKQMPITSVPIGRNKIKIFGGSNLILDRIKKHVKVLNSLKLKYKSRNDKKREEMMNKLIEDLFLQSGEEIINDYVQRNGSYTENMSHLDKHLWLEGAIFNLVTQCDHVLDEIEKTKCKNKISEYRKIHEHYLMKRIKDMYKLKNEDEIKEILEKVRKHQNTLCLQKIAEVRKEFQPKGPKPEYQRPHRGFKI